MNIFITGEKGFIGRNLAKRAELHDFNFISGDVNKNSKVKAIFHDMIFHSMGEPCVYGNEIFEWKHFFMSNKIDIVIHNAAAVGTDVVALNAKQSTLTNVQGTYNICRAAKALNIPVCYIGTTVIYDTPKYQQSAIGEDSDRGPTTLYGCQKLCAESIVKTQVDKWMIIRPLFAYGGDGDMNSLIAKTIYASLNNIKDLQMFLDPTKIKDYMHVNDFCDGVLTCLAHPDCWNDDFNLAAETPFVTGEIVQKIGQVLEKDVSSLIKWHPETDYMGNHILNSRKVRDITGWYPRVTLEEGIRLSYQSILQSQDYNPLIYLEEAKSKKIDLTQFF
jgi:nucleoside-diphosphate-sugar epimerase